MKIIGATTKGLRGGQSSIIMQIDTTQAGSASDTFILATTNATLDDYVVDWGDGNSDAISGTASPSHTYTTGGLYTITITGLINQIYFNNGGDKAKVLSTILIDGNLTSLRRSFLGCLNQNDVTGEINPAINDMSNCFRDNDLSSWDVLLPASLLDCSFAWFINNLTSWTVDLPPVLVNCSGAWRDNLLTTWSTDLPSSLTDCSFAWWNNLLTTWSTDLPSSLTNCSFAWYNNNLTSWTVALPSGCTAYLNAWSNNALDQTSVDFILTTIEAHGTSNGTIGISGGTNATPSTTGQTATDALRARGWTVTLNGY